MIRLASRFVDSLRSFKNGVRNIIRWTPVIWGDFDWDWTAIAKVLEFKLRRHARVELTVGHHVGSQRDGRRMLICANLLRRLAEDEYYERCVAQYGHGRISAQLSNKQARADQELLGRLIGKHFTHWLD